MTGVAKGHFKRIHAALVAEGYRVRAKILDAEWLGVPQRRKRVIFVGIRDDLDVDPAFPDPLPYRYSMLDACPWLGGLDWSEAVMGSATRPSRSTSRRRRSGATPEGNGRRELPTSSAAAPRLRRPQLPPGPRR